MEKQAIMVHPMVTCLLRSMSKPHDRFIRNGDNLEITIEISPVQAVLGTSVEIETIDKRHIDLKVPSGIQHNTALKIAGEGIKRRGKPGDLLVRVKIITPKSISSEQRELYQNLPNLKERAAVLEVFSPESWEKRKVKSNRKNSLYLFLP